jgi:hypothetical protein
MKRLEWTILLGNDDLPNVMNDIADRLTWLHDRYGEGDSWDNRSWFRPRQELKARWAFGTYQATILNPIKFCIWLPRDIQLLYDIHWA